MQQLIWFFLVFGCGGHDFLTYMAFLVHSPVLPAGQVIPVGLLKLCLRVVEQSLFLVVTVYAFRADSLKSL